MIEQVLISVFVSFCIGSALYHTYKSVRARRRVEILSMIDDEGFATDIPPWDEGTEQVEPGVAEARPGEWHEFWFVDPDDHSLV